MKRPTVESLCPIQVSKTIRLVASPKGGIRSEYFSRGEWHGCSHLYKSEANALIKAVWQAREPKA